MSTETTPDLEKIKAGQQKTWASGDFAVVAGRIVVVSENLADAADLHAGSRTLDVACGNGNATLAAARWGTRAVGVDYVPALPRRPRDRSGRTRAPLEHPRGRRGPGRALRLPADGDQRRMTKFGVRPSALLAALTVILAAGCAGHTPKPAADPAGCAPGATKNVEGGFCLVLPPGAKADPPVQAGANQRDYTFGVDGHGVNVDVSELNEILTWDMTVKGYQSDQSDAERSQQQTADLPGGGKFFSFFAEGRTQVYVLTHKGDTLLTCKTLGEKPDGPTIDACKSVRPL